MTFLASYARSLFKHTVLMKYKNNVLVKTAALVKVTVMNILITFSIFLCQVRVGIGEATVVKDLLKSLRQVLDLTSMN
jgi:hypothetical protein